jgi:hypothetical protein
MRDININLSGVDMSYKMASTIASTIANAMDGSEPIMVAWHDKTSSRMSPVIEGGDINSRWHDYGASHGGKLEISVNGDFDFIFADSSGFESLGSTSLVSLHDTAGNEYLCQINALRDPKHPTEEACVRLEGLNTKGDAA